MFFDFEAGVLFEKVIICPVMKFDYVVLVSPEHSRDKS
jgi:hypothetical protein